MNTIKSIIRIAMLSILSGVALVLLFVEEQDETQTAFIFHFIVDKGLAVALIYYAGRLYNRWNKIDPWLKACNKMCDGIIDKPNPLQL